MNNKSIWGRFRDRVLSTSIRTRLYFILFCVLVPLCTLTGLMVSENMSAIGVLVKQRKGTAVVGPLVNALVDAQERKIAAARHLTGATDAAETLRSADDRIDQKLAELGRLPADTIAAAGAQEPLQKVRTNWEALKQHKARNGLDLAEVHEKFDNTVMAAVNEANWTSGIMLDGDEYTFRLIYQFADMPKMASYVGEMGALFALGARYGNIEAGEAGRLSVLHERAVDRKKRVEVGVTGALADPMNKELLEVVLKDSGPHTQALMDSVQAVATGRSISTFSPSEALSIANKAQASYGKFVKGMVQTIEKRYEKREQALWRSIYVTVGAVATLIVFTALLLFFVVRSITNPLSAAVTRVKDISEGEGDLTQRIDVTAQDEVGDLGKWMNNFIENLDRMIARVHDVSTNLNGAAGGLTTASQSLSAGTEQVSQQAQSIAGSATQMTQNMQILSSAIEEMSISISEVARKAGEAASVATEANSMAGETNSLVRALGDNAREIGNVIDAITGIASQTNLLALNAAIEAAGAGEAGKGFAVVAAEVKELARQSGESSEEIKRKIVAIQESTAQAVDAIGKIAGVINQVSDISTSIASSVEEQSISAREISSNVTQAASAATEVATNITGISDAARSGAEDASRSSQLAGDLQTLARDLSTIVDKFKFSTREAVGKAA